MPIPPAPNTVVRYFDITISTSFFLYAHYTCAMQRANAIQCVVMTFSMRISTLLFCSAILLCAFPARAAISALSPEQCAELHRINPSLPCVGSAADIAALQLQSSPLGYLEGRTCKGTSLGCLDPQFAVAVQQFYMAGEEAGRQQGWRMPHLTDAWRSPAAQTTAYASGHSGVGPCGSPHNHGLAIDFNDPPLPNGLSPAMKWMRANAHLYGLETIGGASDGCVSSFCDPAHFQIKGWKNRSVSRDRCITSCGAPLSGAVQSCTGGGGGGGVVANAGNAIGNAFSQILRPLTDLLRPQPTTPQTPSDRKSV